MIWLSYVAAFLTTFSFLPQAIKTIKTRDTKDLSLLTYCMFVIGTFTWTLYGLAIHETALFFANIVTTLLAGVILSFKVMDTIKENKKKSHR